MNSFPIPIHVHRLSGIQAAIEHNLAIVAMLPDGLVMMLPMDTAERERVLHRWKNRAHNIYTYQSVQWTRDEWTHIGMSKTPYQALLLFTPALQGLIQSSDVRGPRNQDSFQCLVRDTILREPPPPPAKKSLYTPPSRVMTLRG